MAAWPPGASGKGAEAFAPSGKALAYRQKDVFFRVKVRVRVRARARAWPELPS